MYKRQSESGQVVKEFKLDVDPKTWIPATEQEPNQAAKYTIKGSVAAGVSGTYKVGIWMPEKVADWKYNSVYAIKFAKTENVTHWYDDADKYAVNLFCLLYTSPSPRDRQKSRMPSSA